MPKVSIIVPTYNVEQYLEECMESIINQTLTDIEIVCVDDGSTDNSGKILDNYAAHDSRIKVIHKENGGYGKAMNVGFDNTTGEYIGIVEPDDYIKPEMYETLYNTAIEYDADLIKSDYCRFQHKKDGSLKLFNEILDKTGKYYNKIIDLTKNIIPYKFPMNTWAGIYKREYLLKNNIRHNETPGASYQDNGFWLQTFWHAKRAMFLNQIFYMNRRDNPNSSVKNPAKVFCMKEEYDYIYSLLMKEKTLKKNFLGIYHYKKYQNYIFTFNRIDIKFKKLFLKTFTKELKEAYAKREIDESLFSEKELQELHMIAKHPIKFYRKKLNRLSPMEKLFSLKNQDTHRILRIFGMKLKFKSNKLIERKRIENIEKNIANTYKRIKIQTNLINTKNTNMKQLDVNMKQIDVNMKQINTIINNQYKQIDYLTNQLKKLSDFYQKYNKLEQKVQVCTRNYYMPQINKEKISYDINRFTEFGLNRDRIRNKKIIVSLTSYPERMYDIHYCLYSLLNQSLKPDEVILWLAKEEFPKLENDLSDKILHLTNNGLTIKWCDNIKSYKKLLPALKEYPNDIIVTADDDIFYAKNWLEKLYNEYLESDQKTIIAHRCHKVEFNDNKILPYEEWEKCITNNESSFTNFFTGAGGVLYPPDTLNKEVFNQKLYETLAPTGDDIWFWSMAILNNTKIKIVSDPNKLYYVNPERELNLHGAHTLYETNKLDNDKFISNMIEYFPEIIEKLHTKKIDADIIGVIK